MTQQYRELFSALEDCIDGFLQTGVDPMRSEAVRASITACADTPLGNILRTFGCEDYEAFTVVLGAYASSGAYSGGLPGDTGNACISPLDTAALFYGSGDIMPFYEYLAEEGALARLFEGITADACTQLTLRSSIAVYLFTGELSDPCFDTPGHVESYVPWRGAETAVAEICSLLRGLDPAEPAVIRVCGEEGSGRHTAVYRAFDRLGLRCIPLELPPDIRQHGITELCTKLLLLNCVPVINSRQVTAQTVSRIADEVGTVILITGTAAPEDCGCPAYTVALPLPTMEEQLTLWQTLSSDTAPGTDFAELAGEFGMTPGAIVKALRCASLLTGDRPLTLHDIKAGCCRSFEGDMGSRAVKIEPVFTWDDLVLPEHSKGLLRAACDQVRLRHKVFDNWGFGSKLPYGRSVSMIFTGPPGTGKTMAAQIIASELGMEIYRISLANVVSKYIGETEKNLNEIFDRARKTRAILFFDEADALFSRRTEVRDSNDKYSNMEAAFLLQKTEEFSGVVILATNLVQNFDEAFKRRMRFIVDFPFPDADRRRELWKRAFPDKAPLGAVDFDFLVEHYELSGSNIRSIALHSAFLAASQGSSIGMEHIMAALRNEYAKSGKAFTKAEAGEYHHLLGES